MFQNYLSNNFMLKVYLLLIIFDTLTGLGQAVYNKNIQSRILYNGIIKLIFEILTIFIFIYATTEIPELVQYKVMVLTLLLLKEAISISENLGRIGIIIPQEILNYLPNSKEKDK